jgi:hypothetical protein
MSRHLLGLLGLFLPASSNSLPLSVKSNCTLSVEVSGTPHGGFVAGEAEHRKGNWDRKIDSNLASLDLSLELASSVSVLREN